MPVEAKIIKTINIPEYPKDWFARAALVLQDGMMPVCIVAREVGGDMPFATHKACIQEYDGKPAEWVYVYGTYHKTKAQALKKFNKRAPKNLNSTSSD